MTTCGKGVLTVQSGGSRSNVASCECRSAVGALLMVTSDKLHTSVTIRCATSHRTHIISNLAMVQTGQRILSERNLSDTHRMSLSSWHDS